jgi:hypothetical protein
MNPEDTLPCSQETATETTLSQLNPFHILTPYFLKIYFNRRFDI